MTKKGLAAMRASFLASDKIDCAPRAARPHRWRPQGAPGRAGNGVESFRYADYGIPDQHTIILAGDTGFLDARPEAARAFVAATRAGYARAVANPQEAADILIAAAPELAAQRELVEASMQVMVEGNYLMRPDGTIGRFDGDLMAELGDFLFAAGALIGPDGQVLREKPDFSA